MNFVPKLCLYKVADRKAMEIDVGEEDHSVMDNVETVEVVASGDDMPVTVTSAGTVVGGLMDQHMIIANPEGILVPTSEVQIESQALSSLEPESQGFSMSGMGVVTIPVEPPTSPTHSILLGTKRSHPDSVPPVSSVAELPMTTTSLNSYVSGGELPRKKSRNYLDSHKTIEKKRRDRINQCLENLKSLIPDCRQYGSKKLDKAEILEMCIEYIHKMQTQVGVSTRLNASGLELNLNQREWANDLCTWVISNKILYSGTNALDQFCQALLLHLQGMGSGNALASATSMLIHQANSGSEEDSLLRQQTVAAQVAILQQLQQQLGALGGAKDSGGGGGGGGGVDTNQLQQAQLSQLQALLLLQQHQQQQQQQQQETEAQSLQLQQLQQLQALILQHLTNEAVGVNAVTTPTSVSALPLQNISDSVMNGSLSIPNNLRHDMAAQPKSPSDEHEQQQPHDQLTVVSKAGSALDHSPEVELAHPSDALEETVTAEETVYTTAIPGGLDDENLNVNQTPSSAITTSTTQMWSVAGQSSSLLMLGGGSESEGEGPAPGAKSQLIETSIISPQEEDVELLTQPEQ